MKRTDWTKGAAVWLVLLSCLLSACASSKEPSGVSTEPSPYLYSRTTAEDRVLSHRGASLDEIEHTFAAYDRAIEYGSKNLELDLVTSADGTLYVSHDASVRRLTGQRGFFASMTDSEIDRLTVPNGEKIHTLREVFDRYGDTVHYVVELKEDISQANVFADLVEAYHLEDCITVQSFESRSLEWLEERFPFMEKIRLVRSQYELENGLEDGFSDGIGVKQTLMTEDNCRLIHDFGKEFLVWTIDSEDDIKNAISMGADAYFTNDTQLALSLEKSLRP